MATTKSKSQKPPVSKSDRPNGVGGKETPLPEGEVERAVRRAGIVLDASRESFGPKLRLATELLSEILASHEGLDGTDDALMRLNRLLWEVRWEHGVLPPDEVDDEGAIAAEGAS